MGKHETTALSDIDKPIFSYKKALFASFFNFKVYVDVVKRWKGLGIAYLLLATLIFSIPLSLRIAYQFNDFFNHGLIGILQEMPTLTIQNGEVSIQQATPYLIKNEAGNTIAIIDPHSNKGAYAVYQDPALILFVTKSKIFYRAPVFRFINPKSTFTQVDRSDVYYQEIPKEANEIFDGAAFLAQANVHWLGYIVIGIIYPVVVSLLWGVYTLFFLTFGVAAQFIAKLILKAYLSYLQTCRLLVVSATPAVALLITLVTCDWVFKGSGLVVLGVMATYFSMATLAYRRQAHKLVR